mmetsp:Transcript_6758/g.9948  ORF Transcript_6758/g.9948 Transcript_6758/m.9948 type:complete len:108 (+) Transcript_6758:544-867(+)
MRRSSLTNVCESCVCVSVADKAVTGLLLTGSGSVEGPENVCLCVFIGTCTSNGVKAETETEVCVVPVPVPAATKVSIAPINFNEQTILKISSEVSKDASRLDDFGKR